jgi:CRISPR/Cas system-associated exonuclease Cas4 (RecB family)
MKTCPLRSCFEASAGYERRKDFTARIGQAFHRTIEYLTQNMPAGLTADEAAELARQHFELELNKEKAAKMAHPREKSLPLDENRINLALEAAISEAQRLVSLGYVASRAHSGAGEDLTQACLQSSETKAAITMTAEIAVASRDGFLRGRIDRVEFLPEGVRLIDFKTTLKGEVPEYYHQQLQLYAYLWHEAQGQWPREVQLIYSFTGLEHTVPIEAAICEKAVADFRKLVETVRQQKRSEKLAKPGEGCSTCQFRPWCRPFFDWQATQTNIVLALQNAFWGFEGQIVQVETLNHYWKVELLWRDRNITLRAPVERFPQLSQARAGMYLRALGIHLQGRMASPTASISEISEIFIVVQPLAGASLDLSQDRAEKPAPSKKFPQSEK